MAKKKAGRGRPAIFVGELKKGIIAIIKEHGLTGARQVIAKGTTLANGKGIKMKISMPTLGKLAKGKVKLHRGRPAKAA